MDGHYPRALAKLMLPRELGSSIKLLGMPAIASWTAICPAAQSLAPQQIIFANYCSLYIADDNNL
jgi:hypothetical protein